MEVSGKRPKKQANQISKISGETALGAQLWLVGYGSRHINLL